MSATLLEESCISPRYWRKICLSVTMSFQKHEGALEAFICNVNLRNESLDNYEAVFRSGAQRVLELMIFKGRMEAQLGKTGQGMSSTEVFEQWQMRVPDSKSLLAEKVDADFVADAVRVYNRLLCTPALRQIVFDMENAYGKASPFSTLAALSKVVSKADPVRWTLQSVQDVCLRGLVHPRAIMANTPAPRLHM